MGFNKLKTKSNKDQHQDFMPLMLRTATKLRDIYRIKTRIYNTNIHKHLERGKKIPTISIQMLNSYHQQ